jgi:hypothetical protein
MDVAEWMFGSPPESIIGVGGHDYQFDGRDILDNIQMIYKYPKKQKLISMYISTNSHLSLFSGTRTEFGETIMGTEGAVEMRTGVPEQARVAHRMPPPVDSDGRPSEHEQCDCDPTTGQAAIGQDAGRDPTHEHRQERQR